MLAGTQENKNNNNKSEMLRKPPIIPQLFLAIQEQFRLIQNYEILCRTTKRLANNRRTTTLTLSNYLKKLTKYITIAIDYAICSVDN